MIVWCREIGLVDAVVGSWLCKGKDAVEFILRVYRYERGLKGLPQTTRLCNIAPSRGVLSLVCPLACHKPKGMGSSRVANLTASGEKFGIKSGVLCKSLLNYSTINQTKYKGDDSNNNKRVFGLFCRNTAMLVPSFFSSSPALLPIRHLLNPRPSAPTCCSHRCLCYNNKYSTYMLSNKYSIVQ